MGKIQVHFHRSKRHSVLRGICPPTFIVYRRYTDLKKHMRRFKLHCNVIAIQYVLLFKQFLLSLQRIAFYWYCLL